MLPGLDKGVIDMCVGEKRTLKIPPKEGYGPKGYPPTIPANADLIFHIHLEQIESPPEQARDPTTPRKSTCSKK